MPNVSDRLAKIGAKLPDVLLPVEGSDMHRWAVVACDQFSSDRRYWDETGEIVGDAPSTFNLMLPECYLEDGDTDKRVEDINRKMREYIDKGLFREIQASFVLVNRSTSYVPSRKGLVISVDLEAYSFEKGAQTLIRPTEGTIISRLPPRMKIRRGASLDLPHILLLMDDPHHTVIEPLYERRAQLEKLYDFDLVKAGGHITGWRVTSDQLEHTVQALEKLASGGFLFAVGDGNHSLASAKQLWEEKKAQGAPDDHPARWALVEVENIHDDGLPFHPIHRVLFGVDSSDIFSSMEINLGGVFSKGNPDAHSEGEHHSIGWMANQEEGLFSFSKPGQRMTVEYLQEFLDEYLAAHKNITIDYIHGEDAVKELGRKAGNAGFILPHIDKSCFFKRIVEIGPYPRKTFSIGEATEKRYYLEARKLTKE